MSDETVLATRRPKITEVLKRNFEHFAFVHSARLVRLFFAPTIVVYVFGPIYFDYSPPFLDLPLKCAETAFVLYVIWLLKTILSPCQCGTTIVSFTRNVRSTARLQDMPKSFFVTLGLLIAWLVIDVLVDFVAPFQKYYLDFFEILALVAFTYTSWFKRWQATEVFLLDANLSPAMLAGKSADEIIMLIKSAQMIGLGDRAAMLSQVLLDRAEALELD
jgi:hypothetical protein